MVGCLRRASSASVVWSTTLTGVLDTIVIIIRGDFILNVAELLPERNRRLHRVVLSLCAELLVA